MNPDSLRALLIDRQLGELTPEAAELLDAYLAQSAESKAEATKMRTALGITERTVNERAELFREKGDRAREFSYTMFHGLFRASAFAILFVFAGLLGFYFGHQKPSKTKQTTSLFASAENTPWARYRLSEDSGFSLITNQSNRKTTEKE